MKMIRILHFLLPLCCLPSVSLAADVIQTPKLFVARSLDIISLTCEHEDTSKYTKLWYRQKMGKELVLMGLTNNQEKPDMEKGFEGERFNIFPEKTEKSILTIRNVTVEDNAVYYCASSTPDSNAAKLEFGGGTILSVLGEKEKQIEPKVRLFPPDKQEFKEHSLLSLVCVASGFFPEHVRLTWYLNNEKIESLYQNVPKRDENNTYSTSSRLSLTESQYFNPDTKIRCEAAFVGSNITASDETHGELGCGVSKESYGMYMNQGKISYIMVLFKSGLYALIVMAVIWRRKALSGSC